MRNKSILIAIVMVSSSLAGCTSDNSEDDLSAKYQEAMTPVMRMRTTHPMTALPSITTMRDGTMDGR